MYSSEPLGLNVPLVVPTGYVPIHYKQIFHPNSIWYSQIPANAPLNPDQAGLLQNFLAQYSLFNDINPVLTGTPGYVVPAGTTTYACVNLNGPAGATNQQLLAQAVPLIPNVTIAVPNPPNGDQGNMIYSPSQDTFWDFWEFQKTVPQFGFENVGELGTSGGLLPSQIPCSQSQGINPYPFGETACGLPYWAGLVTAQELLAGQINHAMNIIFEQCSPNVCWPGNRTDGLGQGGLPGIYIPEGMRMRIDPTLNVNNYALSNVAAIVFKAAQTYGFYVMDTSGGINIYFEPETQYTNQGVASPWPYLFGPVFNSNTGQNYYNGNGGNPFALFNNFPFSSLQFMPYNYLAATSHVQGQILADGNATAVSSTSLTLPATVGSGNIVLGGVVFNGSGTITITDNQSNSYTVVDTTTISGGSNTLYTFYGANITNAPQIITATKSTGTATFWRMLADEFTGYHTLDSHATNTAASGNGQPLNSFTAGSVTTSVQNDLVYSVLATANSGDFMNNGQDYFSLQVSGTGDTQQIWSEVYTLNREGGAIIPGNWNPFGTVPYACSMMAFK